MASNEILRCALLEHSDDYIFTSHLDDPWLLTPTATVADLLRQMTEDHSRWCGCHVRVGRQAWFYNCTSYKIAPTGQPLSLDTLLSNLIPKLDQALVHVVVIGEAGDRSLLSTYSRSELPSCQIIDRSGVAVFNLSGDKMVLPTDASVNYAEMCAMHGLLFVDKTRFVLPQFSQPEPTRLSVLRRPAGFGKTTFLSMLTTYFDIACPAAYFSSLPGDDIPPHLEYLDAAAGLLVLHMDLAELCFDNTMSDDAMYDVCDRFLDAAGQQFFHKYAHYLGEPYPPGSGGHSCIAAIYAAQRSGYQVFLAIDNYTSPFSRVRGLRWESIICVHIMLPILKLMAEGHIARGVMVGTDLGAYRPFEFSDQFKALTIDLTNASELATACGFTADEVHLLGYSAGIENLLPDVRLALRVPGSQAESQSRSRSSADPSVQIFCARDVLALARQHLSPTAGAPGLLPVNAINVAVRRVVDQTDLHDEDSDETLVEDEVEKLSKDTTPFESHDTTKSSKYDTSWMLEFMDDRDI